MTFQQKMQLFRKEKGLSQEQLAEKVGVSRQAVAKWEAGQSYPEVDKLLLLSELFIVTLDRLIKEDVECGYALPSNQSILSYGTIIDFLIRAKRDCYAGQGGETTSSRPASHDLKYGEGELF